MQDNTLIILGTAHRLREPGKQSPDGRLKECLYSREVIQDIEAILKYYGYNVVIDYLDSDLPQKMQSSDVSVERSRELNMRVKIVNDLCEKYGSNNVLYVSVHVDAGGMDGKWHSAHGWSVRVSPKSSKNSRLLAECLFDAAKSHGLSVRQPLRTQKYWEQSLKVLNDTSCPAVLTENLFQDNKEDVDFLLSNEGMHEIAMLHVEGIIKYLKLNK